MGPLHTLVKLLIVDDEESLLELMKQLLLVAGYDVQAVSSGKEALAVIKADPPELVITDIRMPLMSGLDLLVETISAVSNSSCPPFILISAAEFPVTQKEAAGMGVKALLAKPFDPEILLETVAKALE